MCSTFLRCVYVREEGVGLDNGGCVSRARARGVVGGIEGRVRELELYVFGSVHGPGSTGLGWL